ncbi:MAG: hypothetical protein ACK6DC_01540 [Planctomycetota bacterium]|jgi:hypothetical protein
MPSKPDSLHRWQERYRCPEHGSVSTKHCLICDAEHALEQRLYRERLRVSVDPITVDEILRDAGIDPVRPQDEPLASDEPTSEQSSQDAAERVTGDARGVGDPGAGEKLGRTAKRSALSRAQVGTVNTIPGVD